MSFFILISGVYQARWLHNETMAERSGGTSVVKTFVAAQHVNSPWKISHGMYFMSHQGTSRVFLKGEQQIKFENKLAGEISLGIGMNTRLIIRGNAEIPVY